MKYLKRIRNVVIAIVGILFIVSLFVSNDVRQEGSTVINKPIEQVWGKINSLSDIKKCIRTLSINFDQNDFDSKAEHFFGTAELRYSYDNVKWSRWSQLDDDNLKNVDVQPIIYLNLREKLSEIDIKSGKSNLGFLILLKSEGGSTILTFYSDFELAYPGNIIFILKKKIFYKEIQKLFTKLKLVEYFENQ